MIISFLLKKIAFKNRINLIKYKTKLYKEVSDREKIEQYQLESFNKIWANITRSNPFYKMWKDKHDLPHRINSIEDLKNFPILTKKDIQKNRGLIFNHLGNYETISTGGSSGEPVKFPTSKNEQNLNYANTYLARGWWGIKPLDSYLLFWGHSHLFGTGLSGRINQYKRDLKDWLINTNRLNAYDMSYKTVDNYCKELFRSNPVVIMGYTSIIHKVSRYIKEHNLDIGNKSNLKSVIVTSEVVTNYDIELIESVFNVPCVIEYGMAETGVIAFQHNKSKNLKVFWDSFICVKNNNNNLLVSTINNRIFPLINYQTDDIVKCDDFSSILLIDEIQGREKDVLNIADKDGVIILSGILMIHILKSYKGIYSIQFRQLKGLRVEVRLVADSEVSLSNVKQYFLRNIRIDHADVSEDSFVFKNVNNIEKTIAGKEIWIKLKK